MTPNARASIRLLESVNAVCPGGVRIAGDSTAVLVPADGVTPEQIAAGEAALAAFDWSPEAQAAWELQQSIAAGLAGLMADASPVACGLRFYLRILTDRVNTLARLAGVPPILEADLPALAAEYGFLAAPGPRSDV